MPRESGDSASRSVQRGVKTHPRPSDENPGASHGPLGVHVSDLRSLRTGLLVLAAGLLASACTTTVPIRSTRPGPVALGGVHHLVILDGEGRRDARETVFRELGRQARSGGWFTVDDLSEDGHRVWVQGRQARVDPGYPLEEEAAGLRVEIEEWQVSRNTRTVETQGGRDEVEPEMVRSLRGSVRLTVTLFDAWGNVLLAERSYAGSSSATAGEVTRSEVIDRTAADAVARLLADLTPRSVIQEVRLDAGDNGQEAILAVAEDGNTALAARRMRAYASGHPQSAAAAYNLAVLLDALGERHEALAWYDRALELGAQGYYASARTACLERIADTNALLPYQPPAALGR
jgi:hypothetical protein